MIGATARFGVSKLCYKATAKDRGFAKINV
jgi:hypothetical protein